MLEIRGKYNTAIVYADQVEPSAIGQLTVLCSQPFIEGSTIRIMPDVHAGAGCVVGTTLTIKDKIVPNLVGVDISCALLVTKLNTKDIDCQKLDVVIRERVPSGFSIREQIHSFAKEIDLDALYCAEHVQQQKGYRSIGSLGGGNHFIEIDHDENTDEYYLVIHSGSRHLGLEIANWYQKIAIASRTEKIPPDLAYVHGEDFEKYIHDMIIVGHFADLNRKTMAHEILKGMKWKAVDQFTTIHNYIDTKNMILRKGSISAQKDEICLIPMNMKDGSLLCKGKGNPEWNYSAPHGAGRLFSRGEAKRTFTVSQFKKEMNGIYSSCICDGTLDESPMAYKPIDEILKHIGDTVDVISTLKPIYNFKATGKEKKTTIKESEND